MIRQYLPAQNPDDREPLQQALKRLFNHPESLKYLSFTLKPFDEGIITGWCQSHEEHGIAYYADQNEHNAICGLLVLKSDLMTGCEILGVAVDPAARRQGIGQTLIGHALDVARQHGFQAVDVAVYCDNTQMLRAVLKQGFIPVRMKYHVRADGADLLELKRYV